MIKRVFGFLSLSLVCCLSFAQQSSAPQAFFPVGSSSLDTLEVSPGFADSVRAATADGGKYTLWGVASPEGRYQSNVRLAQRRADAILRAVVRQTGLPDSLFETRTRVMEASDLRDLVAQTDAMPGKDEVLRLLDAGGPTPAVLRRLKQLYGGAPYQYIKNRLFPYLRTSVAANTDSLVYRPSLTAGLQPVVASPPSVPPIRDAVAPKSELRHSAEITEAPADTSAAESGKEPADRDTVSAEQTENAAAIPPSAPPAPSVAPYWLAIIALLLLMAGIIVYYRRRVAALSDELSAARLQLDLQKSEYENNLAAETEKWSGEVEKARIEGKSQAEEEARTEAKKVLYNDGETLYRHLLAGGAVKDWTAEQTNSFINYYKVRNFALVSSLETDYDGLTPNQILFEILVDMKMTDAEIQRVMGISQTTIRSNRFRIRAKKRSV